MNNKICLFTLQNKLKNIIITVVNLRSIVTRSVVKTLNLKNENKMITS